MKLALRLVALPLIAVFALTFAPPSQAKPTMSPTDLAVMSQILVDLTNQQRDAAGLVPLRWNSELAVAAGNYAREMAGRGFFAHDSPDGTTPVTRSTAAGYPSFPWGAYVGENLAKGFDSPDAVVRGWMNSEGHRRNVLLPDYIETGVGIATAPDGTLYWAQEFGNRPLEYPGQ